jgi:hypothetical protein
MARKKRKWDKAQWMASFAGFKTLFDADWDPMSPQASDAIAMKALEILRQIKSALPRRKMNLAVVVKNAGATIKEANELEDYLEMFEQYDKSFRKQGEDKDRLARDIAAKDVVALLLRLDRNERLAQLLAEAATGSAR